MSDAETTATDAADAGRDDAADQKPDDRTELKTALSKERDARQQAEKSAKDLERRLRAIEDRDKSDLQKAQDRATELEKTYGETITELQRERAERVIRDAATEANANPQRLASIFRLVRDDIEYGDDGKPSNVSALISKAKKDSPEWFRSALGSGDGGKGGDTPADRNELVNAFIRGGR